MRSTVIYKGKDEIMKKEKKAQRQSEIETAAYELLDEFGYDGISMLKIAKRAKASNETIYRWYGDKLGLFESLVKNNTNDIKETLSIGLNDNKPPLEILQDFGPKLLTLLLSPRAIALNRAAAGDPSGILGKALAKHGRETVLPLLIEILSALCKEKIIMNTSRKLAEIYIRLLVGDMQIRRVTSAVDEVTAKEINQRSIEALNMVIFLAEL